MLKAAFSVSSSCLCSLPLGAKQDCPVVSFGWCLLLMNYLHVVLSSVVDVNTFYHVSCWVQYTARQTHTVQRFYRRPVFWEWSLSSVVIEFSLWISAGFRKEHAYKLCVARRAFFKRVWSVFNTAFLPLRACGKGRLLLFTLFLSISLCSVLQSHFLLLSFPFL